MADTKYDLKHFQAMTCPASVTWTNDIKQMFNTTDIEHMKSVTGGSLDLSDYNSTKIYATQVYSRVAAGNMPPPPAEPWSKDKVDLFGCWIQKGTPE